MNAAEEIVKYWYQSRGYFVMESIRLERGREIDLLAIKLSPDKKRVLERIHVEIQVSNNSINSRPVKEQAKEYHAKKFLAVRKGVVIHFGKDYKMVEVRGEMSFGRRGTRSEYIKLREKKGVKVIPFESILQEVVTYLTTETQSNPVIQAIQLNKFQL